MRRRLALDAAFAALVGILLVAGGAQADAVVGGTPLTIARAVRLLGIGAVTGVLALTLVVWMPLRRAGRIEPAADEAFVRVAGWAVRRLALLGAVGAVVALVLQTSVGGPSTLRHVVAPDRWHEALGTRTADWLAISTLALAGLALIGPAAIRARSLRSAWALPVSIALLVVLIVAPAVGGTPVPDAVIGGLVVPRLDAARVAFEVLHIAAMGAWVGGLLALLVVLPAATRALPDPEGRTRLTARVLLRFSPLALSAVALLTLAGTALALLSLTTLYDLADTAYGRAIFVKVVILLVAIGIAVVQREYLVPRLERAGGTDADPGSGSSEERSSDRARLDPKEAGRHVRMALRAELLLLVAVLIVTGALVGYTPPKALVHAPATATVDVGDQQWSLTVEPARAGTTSVTLFVIGPKGAWIARGTRPRVRAVPPGRAGSSDRPFDVRMETVDSGYWEADAVELGARGTWKFQVRLRAPDGAVRQATLPVRIR